MKAGIFALALLLSASLAFSLWNYTLPVTALDLNGTPVENADVSIVYQKMASLSEDDGLLTGATDENGTYLAKLENKVHQASQTYKIKLTVSTSYWSGETRRMELNESINKTAETAYCGDGVITGWEECDPYLAATSLCPSGKTCQYCKCAAPQAAESVCGNNRREGNEQCDGTDRGICTSNQMCSACKCVVQTQPATHTECCPETKTCRVVEGAGTNQCSTDADCTAYTGG